MISRIEINFAIPVNLTDEDRKRIDNYAERICRRNEPEGFVHWASGSGDKPIFSQADALFMGRTPYPGAPEIGEPTFDDTVFCIETCCREAYPAEIERRVRQSAHEALIEAHRKKLPARFFSWLIDAVMWLEEKLFPFPDDRKVTKVQ